MRRNGTTRRAAIRRGLRRPRLGRFTDDGPWRGERSQERECLCESSLLRHAFTRRSNRFPAVSRDEERPWRVHAPRDRLLNAHDHGGEPFRFDGMGCQSDGLVAKRSDRDEKDSVHVFVPELTHDGRERVP